MDIKTPEDKAIELISYFKDNLPYSNKFHEYSIKHALFVVNQVLESSPSLPILSDDGTYGSDIQESTEYWKKVKEELEKKNKPCKITLDY